MTEIKTRLNTCVNCNREFTLLDFEDGINEPLYCSPECEEQHSIFSSTNDSQPGMGGQ